MKESVAIVGVEGNEECFNIFFWGGGGVVEEKGPLERGQYYTSMGMK